MLHSLSIVEYRGRFDTEIFRLSVVFHWSKRAETVPKKLFTLPVDCCQLNAWFNLHANICKASSFQMAGEVLREVTN